MLARKAHSRALLPQDMLRFAQSIGDAAVARALFEPSQSAIMLLTISSGAFILQPPAIIVRSSCCLVCFSHKTTGSSSVASLLPHHTVLLARKEIVSVRLVAPLLVLHYNLLPSSVLSLIRSSSGFVLRGESEGGATPPLSSRFA